ncbi:MAG: tetratricopeptide repeat protein [Flavobacteriales bacterium]|nr:tetratricopeptide repeat protein [Flavobacteriales bacterium]
MTNQRKIKLLDMLNDNPEDAFIKYALGMEALAEKDFVEAINYFQQTIQLDPKNEAAYYQLASIYANIDLTDVAKTYAMKGMKIAKEKKLIKIVHEFENFINSL